MLQTRAGFRGSGQYSFDFLFANRCRSANSKFIMRTNIPLVNTPYKPMPTRGFD